MTGMKKIPRSMRAKPMATRVVSERHVLATKVGGGQLRFEAWAIPAPGGKWLVTQYSMTYVNHLIYQGDNGRVLGYDNAHGEHHRHYCGKVGQVDFTSYEDIVERFTNEWVVLAKAHAEGKK
jgi:hypothetical protein